MSPQESAVVKELVQKQKEEATEPQQQVESPKLPQPPVPTKTEGKVHTGLPAPKGSTPDDSVATRHSTTLAKLHDTSTEDKKKPFNKAALRQCVDWIVNMPPEARDFAWHIRST